MTSLDNEPSSKGRLLTGKDYLEDLKLHLDVSSKLEPNARNAIPRRKKVYRIAENLISQLNDLEEQAELNSNGDAAKTLISFYYNYGVDNVEDLAMIMAQQYDADKTKQEFKNLVKGNNPLLKFADIQTSGITKGFKKYEPLQAENAQ